MVSRNPNPGGPSFESPPEGAVRPPVEDVAEEEAAADQFIPPQTEAAEEAIAAPEELVAGVDDRLLSIKRDIEAHLVQCACLGGATAENVFEGAGNIAGVGIGIPDDGAEMQGLPGSPSMVLYVVHEMGPEEAKKVCVDSFGVSAAASDDIPMHVVTTGRIEAQPHTFRIRPAPSGVSIGHFRITAGTLGHAATGLSAPRNRRLLVLSNNHVLANTNAGRYGDPILQPGPADGGRDPADRIAILERFVPINFASGALNYVDCATGWAWHDRVRKEEIYVSGGTRRFFNVGSIPVAPYLGQPVGKSGRTTQLTSGRVTAVNVTVNVNFGGGRVATFADQIAIRANTGNFSAGGDSGSLIWTWDTHRRPVGLLFAGGGGTTFGNKIGRVLTALQIRLVT